LHHFKEPLVFDFLKIRLGHHWSFWVDEEVLVVVPYHAVIYVLKIFKIIELLDEAWVQL
jgi:hypothetical protein